MSLYASLNIGVAGLTANAQALNAASSNIANVNTVGYKEETAGFSTFLASTLGGSSASAGVTAVTGQNVAVQGLPTATTSPTDLAISGNGFFVVGANASATAQQEYTRAGSFTPDSTGNLKNAAGFYLLGWPLDSGGNVPADSNNLSLINVSSLSGKAQATQNITLQANLQASTAADSGYAAGDMTAGNVAPDFTRTVNVYDSQGGTQPIQFSFIKTAANSWAYEATYEGNSANLSSAGPIAQGTMSFNADGSLATADASAASPTGSIALTIPWDNSVSGLDPQTISVNLGTVGGTDGLTQFNADSTLGESTVDGSPFGSVTGVSVGTDGTVTAQFSNGLSQDVYKIPLATFTNPDGLAQLSGNAYAATKESGAANVNAADSGSAGSIQAQSLEGSTVDLAAEFTDLIVTQRAYSASARVITTVDEMLQQLGQLPST